MCQRRLLSKRFLSMTPIITHCGTCIPVLSPLVDNCHVTVSIDCVILRIRCHLFSSSAAPKCIILIDISISLVFCANTRIFTYYKQSRCSWNTDQQEQFPRILLFPANITDWNDLNPDIRIITEANYLKQKSSQIDTHKDRIVSGLNFRRFKTGFIPIRV